MFYCVGFLKYHQTANTVTLNKSENAVGNIITLLHSFRRSEDAYRAACENLKAWHQTVCYVSHCQSVLSWQAILLDAVPSAFRLRSLRRGRGGLSFAWQLFSCWFISVGITSFQKCPSPYTQKNQGNYKPFQKVFWKSASFTKRALRFCWLCIVDFALHI